MLMKRVFLKPAFCDLYDISISVKQYTTGKLYHMMFKCALVNK